MKDNGMTDNHESRIRALEEKLATELAVLGLPINVHDRIAALEALLKSVAEHAAEASKQNGLRIVFLESALAKQHAVNEELLKLFETDRKHPQYEVATWDAVLAIRNALK